MGRRVDSSSRSTTDEIGKMFSEGLKSVCCHSRPASKSSSSKAW